jgi:hypothetical protein
MLHTCTVWYMTKFSFKMHLTIYLHTTCTWRRGLVVSSPPTNEETGAMGREIESHRGIALRKVFELCTSYNLQTWLTCWANTWGRCYDHNFLRFFSIFGEKVGVFIKNQCYDQLFSKLGFVLRQKRQFFRWIFRRKYLKNHNIGPCFFHFGPR